MMKGDDSSWVFVYSVTASTAVYIMDLSMGLTGDVGSVVELREQLRRQLSQFRPFRLTEIKMRVTRIILQTLDDGLDAGALRQVGVVLLVHVECEYDLGALAQT